MSEASGASAETSSNRSEPAGSAQTRRKSGAKPREEAMPHERGPIREGRREGTIDARDVSKVSGEAFLDFLERLFGSGPTGNSSPTYMAEQLIEGVPTPEVRKKQRPVRHLLDYKIRGNLPTPIQPQPFVPARPPRRTRRYREVLREFDPFALTIGRGERARQVPGIEELAAFDSLVREGAEVKTGRRFIRWRLVEDLGHNQTEKFLIKNIERLA